MYEIYDEDITDDEKLSVDGGLCTTTMRNALGMAVEQAERIIIKEKGVECSGCSAPHLESDAAGRALSRYGYGTLCSDCGVREALEGDFIGER